MRCECYATKQDSEGLFCLGRLCTGIVNGRHIGPHQREHITRMLASTLHSCGSVTHSRKHAFQGRSHVHTRTRTHATRTCKHTRRNRVRPAGPLKDRGAAGSSDMRASTFVPRSITNARTHMHMLTHTDTCLQPRLCSKVSYLWFAIMPYVSINDGAQPGVPTRPAHSRLHDLLLMNIADGAMSIATAVELAHASSCRRSSGERLQTFSGFREPPWTYAAKFAHLRTQPL